jgi:hypothetical protein
MQEVLAQLLSGESDLLAEQHLAVRQDLTQQGRDRRLSREAFH